MQYTGQQLGSSLGVALIGAIVLAGLTGTFVSTIQADERISDEVAAQVGVAVGTGIDFVSSADVEAAVQQAGLDEATTQAIVEDYETAQLQSLKTACWRWCSSPSPHWRSPGTSLEGGSTRAGARKRCRVRLRDGRADGLSAT